MPSVSRTFTVEPDPATVIDFLKDFGNAEQWDPGTQSCTRTDSGPVAVGASWHNVSKFFGTTAELDYTLQELSADRLVFIGKNKSVTSTDAISVRPSGTGAELTYDVDLELSGAAKLAAPAMKLAFEKLATDTQEQLTTVLNGLTSAPPT